MKIFVECFLADPQRNASRAVVEAGYKTTNPNRVATQLLRHPLVSKAIHDGDEARRERMEFSADFLLTKLMTIITDDGVKTTDKLRAIELAGKSIALWKDRQEISGPDGEAIKMEQKVKQDVADFQSRLTRLASSGGAGTVTQFPKPGESGGS
jgi:phage terminase small subunit